MALPLLPSLFAAGISVPAAYSIFNSLAKGKNTTSDLLNKIEIPISEGEVANIPRKTKEVTSKVTSQSTPQSTVSNEIVPSEVRDSIAPEIEVMPKEQLQSGTYEEPYVEPRYKPYEWKPASTPEADALAIQNAKEQAATQKMREMQANLGVSEGIPTGPGFYESATPSFRFIDSNTEYERLSTLADLVLKGKMGNGASRKKNLGADYANVQKIVNERMKGTKSNKDTQKATPNPYEAGLMHDPETGFVYDYYGNIVGMQ